jgi:hypothetical protein
VLWLCFLHTGSFIEWCSVVVDSVVWVVCLLLVVSVVLYCLLCF